MKTAKELFSKYEILAPSEEDSDVFDQHTDCVDYDGFFKALADYKQSIIGLIDEMAEKESPYYRLGVAKIAILRELKQKIEEL